MRKDVHYDASSLFASAYLFLFPLPTLICGRENLHFLSIRKKGKSVVGTDERRSLLRSPPFFDSFYCSRQVNRNVRR